MIKFVDDFTMRKIYTKVKNSCKCKCLLFEMHHGMWLDTQETEEALSLTWNVAERSKERFNAEICED